jgi:hypothetical protein
VGSSGFVMLRKDETSRKCSCHTSYMFEALWLKSRWKHYLPSSEKKFKLFSYVSQSEYFSFQATSWRITAAVIERTSVLAAHELWNRGHLQLFTPHIHTNRIFFWQFRTLNSHLLKVNGIEIYLYNP